MVMLQELKRSLSGQIVDIWHVMSTDLPSEQEVFEEHFKNMGYFLYQVEKHTSLKSLLDALYNFEFDCIGYCDEESVNELLETLFDR